MLILYPYKNALWALRLCNRGRLLSVRPAPTLFDHLYASLHKAFGRSISASLPKPQTPFPVKGCVCLVGFASCKALVHTRPASVPGLNVGLPPLDPVGGYAPKQGCFGCLPKVLHDAKPAEQATLDTPFLSTIEVFRQTEIITLFLLFVIRVFAVGIFVLDEDFLYIFKLVLFLFLFHIRRVREIDRLVCFVIYMVDVTVHV